MQNTRFNIEDFFIRVEDSLNYKSSPLRQTNDRASIFSDNKYILKPTTNAKYLLANFYKEKYGIEILFYLILIN